jgi:RND family efflux transporter MFP subunit
MTLNSHPLFSKKSIETVQKVCILGLTVLAGIYSLTACKQNEKEPLNKKSTTDSVAVFILEKQQVNKQLSFPAELSPIERAEIFAKISGYVKAIRVDIGDHVKKGQLLAVLDAPEVISNYAQASADAQVNNARYSGSLDAYNRILNASKEEGTIAAGELEKAKSMMQADHSSLEAARSRLNAFAQLKEYLTITSPFSGIVTQRNIDAGTLAGTANQKPLLVIENTATLRLRVPIPEAYTEGIPDSSFIGFTVDAQPNKKYYAKLSRKSGAINKDNRTESWEFIYNNNQEELKSGMYANAVIKIGRPTTSFVVVPSVIATTLEKKFVIRLQNGKAEWVDIRNGMNTGDKIEIFGNLNTGDTLLIKATDEIKSGTKLIAKFLPK